MKTNDKLKTILMEIIKKPVETQIIPGGINLDLGEPDKILPGYDSELEKIANGLIAKAEQGDIKAIDKIREIVGDIEWPEDIVC